MKRSIIIGFAFALGAVLFGTSPAFAQNYTVALTTHVPTTAAADFTNSGHPLVAGNLHVRKMTISNAGSALQTVTLYNTSTSSLTATIAGYWVVPASSTLQVDLLPRSLRLTNPGWTKSDTGTMYLNVNYE